MNDWRISEDTFDPTPKHMHSQETVFTVGNGYFCTRGTFDEGFTRAAPATLLFGVFDAIPIAREELANAPDWTPIGLRIGGERFRMDKGKLLAYSRTLDIQHGVLRRELRWESPKGIRVRIVCERFASLTDEHVGAIRFSITLEEGSGSDHVDIALWANFNSAVGNYDVMHWETNDQGQEDDVIWLTSDTKKNNVRLAQIMSYNIDTPGFRKEFVDSYIAPSIRLYGTLTVGNTVSTEKLVTMYTSRDVADPLAVALKHHEDLLATEDKSVQGQLYDRLLVEHSAAWEQFWKTTDVIIEGDDKAQLGMRYNIYQLRINSSLHDNRYSIAAKGMTGFGYRGHVFHDTEIFMLPFFTYVIPDIARNLLLYRYNLLPAARKKAAANGFQGAQYPWESTISGEETTPPSIIHPETGEVIPVLNGFIELHITSSIAHATWQYWQVSGDNDFLRDYGAEILLSTATFWVSRAEWSEKRHDYEYTNVIGPDEWHEHVNNNAYTNYMARENIRVAFESLRWLREHAPEKAAQLELQLGLSQERLTHWQEVMERIYIPQDRQSGLFEQFDGFFNLEPLDQSLYKGRKDSYQAILGMKAVQGHRIIKQADVLMLLTVLDDQFDLETKRVNWNYYYPITDHDYGSSLTPAFHTILACELGQERPAYELFMKGALVDLENLRGNTPEGIHTACSGAVWQAVILGFAGLRLQPDGYTTNPKWPDGWTRIAFTFMRNGEPIYVDLRR